MALIRENAEIIKKMTLIVEKEEVIVMLKVIFLVHVC